MYMICVYYQSGYVVIAPRNRVVTLKWACALSLVCPMALLQNHRISTIPPRPTQIRKREPKVLKKLPKKSQMTIGLHPVRQITEKVKPNEHVFICFVFDTSDNASWCHFRTQTL